MDSKQTTVPRRIAVVRIQYSAVVYVLCSGLRFRNRVTTGQMAPKDCACDQVSGVYERRKPKRACTGAVEPAGTLADHNE